MRCKRAIRTRYCYLWAADSEDEALTLRLCAVCWLDMVPKGVHRRLHAAAVAAKYHQLPLDP
jgi:hypothetical protein